MQAAGRRCGATERRTCHSPTLPRLVSGFPSPVRPRRGSSAQDGADPVLVDLGIWFPSVMPNPALQGAGHVGRAPVVPVATARRVLQHVGHICADGRSRDEIEALSARVAKLTLWRRRSQLDTEQVAAEIVSDTVRQADIFSSKPQITPGTRRLGEGRIFPSLLTESCRSLENAPPSRSQCPVERHEPAQTAARSLKLMAMKLGM